MREPFPGGEPEFKITPDWSSRLLPKEKCAVLNLGFGRFVALGMGAGFHAAHPIQTAFSPLFGSWQLVRVPCCPVLPINAESMTNRAAQLFANSSKLLR